MRIQVDKASTRHNIELVLAVIFFFYVGRAFLSWIVLRQWRQTKYMERQYHARALEVGEANDKLQEANSAIQALTEQIREMRKKGAYEKCSLSF